MAKKAKAKKAAKPAPAKRPAARPAEKPRAQAMPAKPTGKKPPDVVRVRAIRLGYYGEERRRVDDVFDMDLSIFKNNELPSWVEEVNPSTRRKRTTGTAELRKQHDETMRERAAMAGGQEGADSVEDTGGNPLGDDD